MEKVLTLLEHVQKNLIKLNRLELDEASNLKDGSSSQSIKTASAENPASEITAATVSSTSSTKPSSAIKSPALESNKLSSSAERSDDLVLLESKVKRLEPQDISDGCCRQKNDPKGQLAQTSQPGFSGAKELARSKDIDIYMYTGQKWCLDLAKKIRTLEQSEKKLREWLVTLNRLNNREGVETCQETKTATEEKRQLLKQEAHQLLDDLKMNYLTILDELKLKIDEGD